MKSVGAKSSTVRRKVAAWAKDVGLQTNLTKMHQYVHVDEITTSLTVSWFLLSQALLQSFDCIFFHLHQILGILKMVHVHPGNQRLCVSCCLLACFSLYTTSHLYFD